MAVTKFTNSELTGTQKYVSMLAGNPAYEGPGAFVPIASATPNGTGVTFDNIPQNYQHLQIRIMGKRNTTSSPSSIFMTFNNVATGTPYDYHHISANGSTVFASGQASANFFLLESGLTSNDATNTFGVGIIDIHDYASTTKNKTLRAIVGQDRNGAGNISLNSALFRSTNAITRIDFGTITYSAGTVISLYGIKG